MEWLSEGWDSLASNVWWRDVAIVVSGVVAHFAIRLFILRGLQRIADATDNGLDDRLVLFVRRFYILILLFVLFLMVLKNTLIDEHRTHRSYENAEVALALPLCSEIGRRYQLQCKTIDHRQPEMHIKHVETNVFL